MRLNPARLVNEQLGKYGLEMRRKRDACAYLKDIGLVPKCIVDVGAHIGQTVALFRQSFPAAKIVAFEPFPGFFEKLSARFGHDQLVSLHHCGLSDRPAQLPMFTGNLNCSLQSPLNNQGRSVDGAATTMIETVVLDDFFEAHYPGQTIDLLKIDIEGHERAALRGAHRLLSAGRVRAVLIEVMFTRLFDNAALAHEIATDLAGFGFVQHQLFDIKLTSQGQMRYANALFVRQDNP